jgi:general secretion pathway protein E
MAGLTTMEEVLRVTPGDSETNPLIDGPVNRSYP